MLTDDQVEQTVKDYLSPVGYRDHGVLLKDVNSFARAIEQVVMGRENEQQERIQLLARRERP